MNETQQYIDQLNTDKSNLVTNLVNKGVSATNDETFTTLVPKVAQIEPILQEKSTYASVSDDVVVTASPSYDGLSKVTVHQITSSAIPNLTPDVIKRNEVILDVTGTYGPTSQVKNATPSTKSQVIKPDEGIEFMSAVNLSAVTSSIDSDIQPTNIKNGITILGVEGTYTGDLVLEAEKTVTPLKDGSTVVPSSGYDAMEQVKINPVTASIDSNIQPQNIKKDITILGVEGTYEPEPTQEKTVTPKTTQQVLQPDEGYSGLSKVTVQGVTSDIDSDIKSSNILDGVTILGVTGNVIPLTPDMLEEKTVTPSTSSQILTPSAEKEGFSKVTVYPVTSAIDTNITPENIKVNKTILGVTGTYGGEDINLQEKTVNPTPSQQEIIPDAEYDGLSKVTVNAIATEELSVTPTTQQQVYDHSKDTPYSKVTVNAVTSSIDSNIQPENIKRNMSILGVVGTYEGEEQTYFGALSNGSSYASGITKAILSVPNDLAIVGTNGDYLFYGCAGLTSIPQLDYSSLTSMNYAFSRLSENLPITGSLTFQSLTSLSNMFSNSYFGDTFTLTLPSCTDISYPIFDDIHTTTSGNMTSIQLNFTQDLSIHDTNSIIHIYDSMNLANLIINGSGTSKVSLSNTFIHENIPGRNVLKVTFTNIYPTSIVNSFDASSYGVSLLSTIELNLDELTSIEGSFKARKQSQDSGATKFTFTGSAQKLENINGAFEGMSDKRSMLVFYNGIPDLGKGFTANQKYYSNYTLDLSHRDLRKRDYILILLNSLYDLNITYGTTNDQLEYRQKIILSTEDYALLSEKDIAIATNKGWDVVESAS